MRRQMFLSFVVLLAASAADAQKTVVSTITGTVMKYHADTIWWERDSTVTRTIYHGDTTVVAMYDGDRLRNETYYVTREDRAFPVARRDTSGTLHAVTSVRGQPLLTVTMARDMLERTIQEVDRFDRIASMGVPLPGAIPLSPATTQTYEVSSVLRLAHHADTVWSIRGCAAAAHTDTTMFVLFGQDSVLRVSPRRMFGQAMALSLISQMRMSVIRGQLAELDRPPPADLPRAPDPCRTP